MSTIREVAKIAGVSVTTVSHVLNQTRFVATETEQRVKRAMLETGYRPNMLARSLRRGETRTLGLIVPDSANPFFAEVARKIEELAFNQQYSVILCNSDGNLEKERRYSEVLFNQQVDGIIFVASGDDTQSVSELIHQKMPVVVMDRILDPIMVDTVISDNFLGGYLATKYLLELGHREIAIIRGPSNLTPSAERVTGYIKAMSEYNIDPPKSFFLVGDFHPRSGFEAGLQLLKETQRPTAIFACNDLMAIGVIRAICGQGFQVPDDISVIGYDDIELANYTQPALTTYSQPITELAKSVLDLLYNRIQQYENPPQTIVLTGKIHQRQSVRKLA